MLGVSDTKEMIAKQSVAGLHSMHDQGKKERRVPTEETADTSQPQTIKTRFGEVSVDRSKSILFPIGILGMPDKHHFALTDFPNEKLGQFKLLQSLDEDELSFIMLPVDLQNSIIERADIEHACADMEISPENLALALIVSVHRGVTSVRLSVNARAPIFMDVDRKAAAQYVFTSNKYQVQHFITEGEEGEA